MKIGITLSHPHLRTLQLDVADSLSRALSLKFSHIRLGAYWSEIEAKEGKYDVSSLRTILEACEEKKQPVIVTVGVKAPRWPEFFWPRYVPEKDARNPTTQERILRYIEHTVLELKQYSCISHWQVENEPLDPSGPENKVVPYVFLKEEVRLVRSLDTCPILLNVWGNDLLSRGLFSQIEALADVVGLELYYKQYMKMFMGRPVYKGPRQSHAQLKAYLEKSKKPVWITELQAEPWEQDDAGYLGKNPGSMNPSQMERNFRMVSDLPVAEVHLWGFEYWLYREKKGDKRYFETLARLRK
jgi:hypothetical protein